MGWIPQISRRFRNVTAWSRVPLGGGGYVCDLRISADGKTRVIKTDVEFSYIWKNPSDLTATDATGTNASFQWVPLQTETSMSDADIFVQGNYGNGFGTHDTFFAPSDPTIIYFLGPGLDGADNYLFKSTDRGNTFTRKAFAGDSMGPQSDAYRMWGPKAGVDPNDPDIVLWTLLKGTDGGKIYRTADGGETAAATSFPASAANLPTAIHFSPVTAGLVFAFRYDTGLYKSTDSGVNWTAVGGTGAPTTCRRMHIDQFDQVWITTSGTNNLVRLEDDHATWTAITGAGGGYDWHAIATNPFSASKATNQVSVIAGGGGLDTSYDNGDTWHGAYPASAVQVATDIPWFETMNNDYMAAGQLVYDTQAVDGFPRGRLWFADGVGVWYGHPLTTNAQPTWTELTRGNDELIPSFIYKLPGASRKLIAGFHDKGVFALDGVNYPTEQLYDSSVNLRHNYMGLDYAGLAPDEFAIDLTAHQSDTPPVVSQIFVSLDGGATGAETATRPYAGHYAAASSRSAVGVSASGVANLVVAGTGYGGGASPPRYTTDGGETWTDCTMSGATYAGLSNPRMTGDKVTPGTFYLFDITETNGGIWRSTNNGATFTMIQPYANFPLSGQGGTGSFIAVPGYAGHVFTAWGMKGGGASRIGGSLHPHNPGGTTVNELMRFSDDGWTTYTDMSDFWLECFAVSVGMPKPGSSYPTLYVSGLKVGDTQPGIYRCTDFDPNDPNAATFTLLPGPYGTYAAMRHIAGDMEVYGDVWIGSASSGLIRGRLV
jgi:xyloglucan-specific exo-beta-1,4-glucanase